MSGISRAIRLLTVAAVGGLLAACASSPEGSIDLMPAPEVFGDGAINPLPARNPMQDLPYKGMLYATDRAPAGPGDREAYYTSQRGAALRLGAAQIALGETNISWEEARRISLLKNRPGNYPIKVIGATEFGILDSTLTPLVDTGPPAADPGAPRRTFAKAINDKLAISASKDVFVYVHGYKVGFENPILVGSELWHFLGYGGVFIAYSWPATPKATAYVGDVDTAAGMARNLRELVSFLETDTAAERIHIIGYSAGTRLVARALEQMTLINRGREGRGQAVGDKLANVILVGSDIDRGVFGAYLADGLSETPRRLTVYGSPHDRALRTSKFLTGHARVGTMWEKEEMQPAVKLYLKDHQARLSFINVGSAADSSSGNGHGYFRASPWVSSDILMTLAYRLAPEERGLVRDADTGILSFPPDYVARMNAVLKAHLPAVGTAVGASAR